MNGDISIGSKVRLSPDSPWVNEYSYDEESTNPLNCIGIVTETYTGFGRKWMTVLWNNGIQNSYKMTNSDLIYYIPTEVEEI